MIEKFTIIICNFSLKYAVEILKMRICKTSLQLIIMKIMTICSHNIKKGDTRAPHKTAPHFHFSHISRGCSERKRGGFNISVLYGAAITRAFRFGFGNNHTSLVGLLVAL